MVYNIIVWKGKEQREISPEPNEMKMENKNILQKLSFQNTSWIDDGFGTGQFEKHEARRIWARIVGGKWRKIFTFRKKFLILTL